MLTLFVVVSILGICSTLPSEIPQNVIIAPPNCTEGQEWVNGACRDIWNSAVAAAAPLKIPSDIDVQNMITVPPNCPPGQQWINGQCRDVWRGGALADSEIFQKFVKNQWAKSIHARNARQAEDLNDDTITEDDPRRNIISVPNQCPEGYRPDAFGICRKQL
ncbi:uncharacterized protein LOC123879475 isoform X1 [Maniola jurtina]|uniref:uncharacterized protein LOC123879475 isoform X1 n=1 Tax=Maniola jurtina TaxID=191418 RepID=UPI001E68CF7D|nr:uncharacterized protein LOC123879475 isoform X1 [Maniola jurtina]XP_045783155.1 uncharacterized protein LOC123879475 isoform X1 [Maniola jurtina]